ncbi:MAG: radical SAM protein [Candidatus Latescibacteria bacterium]|nr:radical SAM protein [Candidatus Latescibacterota bacterium]NIM66311.1 radical SAM protein [Candidatus Latescibacterota bacterium]NIO02790.1 radical SAM protein [Candidatus Latescibacterota bacterium]NIO29925.1 radical SAM protein [Candidatus Latescibacterota bacterium]NIO57540.1 radical SAM protein [Candidatus Latescibacterota bacterium]
MEFSKIKFAALCLTHNCNLRCTYCYTGKKLKKSMNFETARRAVDFLCDNSDRSCIVTFFGGEPLLAFDLMKEIVAYCHLEHKGKIKFRMSTNGTLLNQDTLAYLKEKEIYFVLSIDGSEEQHNKTRRYLCDTGSYRSAVRLLDEIFEFNPYTPAVSVVVPETAIYLASGVQDLLTKGFHYILQTLDYSAQWREKHIKLLREQYKKLSHHYYEKILNGVKIYYSPFDERIKTHAQKRYDNGDLCDLANSQIAIAASGRIYPCVQFIGTDNQWHQKHSIGDVFNGFDDSRRRYYIEQNYSEKKSCSGCALEGRCATYCGCVNWRATGQLNHIPPIICEHERMLMPIVDRLANKLWSKNSELFKRKFYEKTFPISSYIEDCMVRKGRRDAADSKDQEL